MRKNHPRGVKLCEKIQRIIDGKSFHLSPQFVLEMMGYPTDWTLLPFQNGDKSQSKVEATQ